MSVLTNKNVLVVGDENTQIHNLEVELKTLGAKVHVSTCDSVSPEMVNEKKISLVILNHLHEGETCREMIRTLTTAELNEALPVLALVEDSEEKIQDVLGLGATDYLTPSEETGSVVSKIRTIFGEDSGSSGESVIDITPSRASLSKTGVRVYVVEDDPLLRNLLSIRLDRSEFPYEFSDGSKELPVMKQFNPDVIILDLMLPGKSGFDILAEIKQDSLLKDCPVIVFSNRDGQDDRHKAKELGAEAFYVKAMTDLSELIETIERLAK